MKYVDNLLECKPEEIQCSTSLLEIVAIVSTPAAPYEYSKVVIVWVDGSTGRFSLDGRACDRGIQWFIYRTKKVKRLKPLHVILAEHKYINDGENYTIIDGNSFNLSRIVYNQGRTISETHYRYPISFYEEVEE